MSKSRNFKLNLLNYNLVLLCKIKMLRSRLPRFGSKNKLLAKRSKKQNRKQLM